MRAVSLTTVQELVRKFSVGLRVTYLHLFSGIPVQTQDLPDSGGFLAMEPVQKLPIDFPGYHTGVLHSKAKHPHFSAFQFSSIIPMFFSEKQNQAINPVEL